VRSAFAEATGNLRLCLPTVAHVDVGKRERKLVILTFASWNLIDGFLKQIQVVRRGARVVGAYMDPNRQKDCVSFV
jgi:hypothetical protein